MHCHAERVCLLLLLLLLLLLACHEWATQLLLTQCWAGPEDSNLPEWAADRPGINITFWRCACKALVCEVSLTAHTHAQAQPQAVSLVCASHARLLWFGDSACTRGLSKYTRHTAPCFDRRSSFVTCRGHTRWTLSTRRSPQGTLAGILSCWRRELAKVHTADEFEQVLARSFPHLPASLRRPIAESVAVSQCLQSLI